MHLIELIGFALILSIIVYIGNSIYARELKRINFKYASLYVTAVAAMGVSAELIIGTFYFMLFDKPLWQYTLLPIHSGYTSYYAPIIWGIYGLQIYLVHDTFIKKHIAKLKLLISFICIEAIIFEAFVNLLFIALSGQYLYYYYPAELFHLTSVQTLPFYLLAGFVITTVLTFEKIKPFMSIFINTAIALIVIFVL